MFSSVEDILFSVEFCFHWMGKLQHILRFIYKTFKYTTASIAILCHFPCQKISFLLNYSINNADKNHKKMTELNCVYHHMKIWQNLHNRKIWNLEKCQFPFQYVKNIRPFVIKYAPRTLNCHSWTTAGSMKERIIK